MAILKQLALAATTYFEQVIVFCRLDKKMCWLGLLLIMYKEHTLNRSTQNFLGQSLLKPYLCKK